MNYAFASCIFLNYDAQDIPNLSNVDDVAHMFKGPISFNQDIGDWDVSNVTNMEGMVSYAKSFDIESIDWYK